MAKRGYLGSSKKNSLMTYENLLGLILAILIVFDLKLERNIAHVINSPVGIVLSLVLLIVLFVFLNPIIGLLFLIYIYETVKYSSSFLSQYTQPIEKVRSKIMNKLNLGIELPKDQTEIHIIEKMAPLVKKTENFGVKFTPHSSERVYTTI